MGPASHPVVFDLFLAPGGVVWRATNRSATELVHKLIGKHFNKTAWARACEGGVECDELPRDLRMPPASDKSKSK